MTEASSCAHCDAPLQPGGSFCGHCGSPAFDALYCGACEGLVPRDAWFCHHCGVQVRGGDPPVAPAERSVDTEARLPAPGKGVCIEVDLAPGNEDEHLEERMRALGRFESGLGESGARVGRVVFASGDVERLLGFVDEVDLRSGRRVFRDGVQQDWAEFFEFKDCYRGREASQAPDEYCFYDDTNTPNPWGCFRLLMALDSSHEASNWLSLGHFERDGAFVFDKKRMVGLLDERSAPFRLCPALEVRRISTALKAMPGKINPRENRDWRYLEDLSGEDPNAVTVHKRDGDQKVKVRIRGVAPASTDAAERILADIRDQMARQTPPPPPAQAGEGGEPTPGE